MKKLIEIARHKTEIKCDKQEILNLQIEVDIEFRRLIIDFIEKGKKSNEISEKVDSNIASIAILSYLNGIEDTWLINPSLYDIDLCLNQLIEFIIAPLLK